MVAAVYDWSGFYIGLNGGGGSSHNCWDLTANNGVALANTPREGCHDATGGLAGGQIGYRWQSASWVFGVEAQGDWADLKGSSASATAIIPFNNQTKIDAIGLFTGQVGYAWNTVLLYVKGGAAVTHNRYSNYFTVNTVFGPPGTVFNSASDTRWGGTVGAGVEVSFAPNWSVAAEYNHLFMGNPNIAFRGVSDCGFARRQHSPGRRHGDGSPELPLRRPGDREVLIFAYSLRTTKAGLAPAFLFDGGTLLERNC